MRVTILGAGTLLPDDDRRSAAHLVESDSVSLLLDCGSGALHGFDRHDREWRGLTHVVISHFHTDHFGDLAPLLWALTNGVPEGRETELFLLGPRGMDGVLSALARAHGEFMRDPGFPVHVVELPPEGRWDDPWDRLTLFTHPTPHTEESIAIRVETPRGKVGYTGDTGPHPPLGDFFRGVELLIAECAVSGPAELWNHLSPRSVAEIAVRAAPTLLALTHAYPELELSTLPDLLRAAGYTGNVLPARDGMVIEVGSGRAESNTVLRDPFQDR